MRNYKDIREIIEARRKGVTLSEIIDNLITSPNFWGDYGYTTPFEILESIQEGDFLDTTSENWKKLHVEDQIKYASAYQNWYSKKIGYRVCEIDLRDRDIPNLIFNLIPPVKCLVVDVSSADSFLFGTETALIDKPFWMSKFEVTWGQLVSFIGRPTHISLHTYEGMSQNQSASKVKVHEALAFCNELGKNVRLPTSNEWEASCRSGTTTDYYFGDYQNDIILENYAWFSRNSPRDISQPPGMKKPNAWGLYDMLGNVWEYVSNKISGDSVARGGSCSNNFSRVNSSAIALVDQNEYMTGLVGFRPCMDFER